MVTSLTQSSNMYINDWKHPLPKILCLQSPWKPLLPRPPACTSISEIPSSLNPLCTITIETTLTQAPACAAVSKVTGVTSSHKLLLR